LAGTIRCKLITPEAQALDEDITYASIPGWDGLFGVEQRRAAVLYMLGMGPLRLDFPQGGSRWYFVEGGVAHVNDNELTILCEKAVPAEKLDAEEAQAEYAQAQALRAIDIETADRKTEAMNRARIKKSLALAHKGRDGAI